MTPETDTSAGDARRRKGKPTTIDLTATPVGAEGSVAQSEPAGEPVPAAPGGEPAPADPAPAATVDGEPEALAVAAATEPAPDAAPPVDTTDPATAEAAAVGPVAAGPAESDVTGERFAPPPPPSAEPPPEQRRGSPFGLIAAALVGGLIGMGGGALMVSNGLVQPPREPAAVTPDMIGAVDQKVGDLDQRLARIETAPAPQPDAGLADRIGKLEQAVAALPPPDPAIAQRLSDIEATVKTLPSGGGAPTAAAPDVSGLESAIGELKARVDALPPPPADPAPQIAALATAVDALKSDLAASRRTLDTLAAAPAPVDPARVDALEAGMTTLSGRIEALDTGIAGLKQALGDETGGLRTAIEEAGRSLGDEIAGLKTAQGEAATAATGLADRIATIEQRLDAGPKGGEIAALSLAVTTLSSRIAEGAPFEADLAVIEKTAPDLPEVEALKPIAATGVDTIDRLAETLPVDAIMAARPVATDTGVLDRVVSGAKSLVNYRESGPQAEDPASKAVDGIRAALAAGDALGAKAAAEALPDWAKAPAAAWLGRLDARATADAAVHALTAKMLDRLKAPAEGQ